MGRPLLAKTVCEYFLGPSAARSVGICDRFVIISTLIAFRTLAIFGHLQVGNSDLQVRISDLQVRNSDLQVRISDLQVAENGQSTESNER